MTQDVPQPPEDRPPYATPPAPDGAPARPADRWDGDAWRGPLTGAALAVLTLPAVAMAIVGLLVLAVQGTATWLVVTGVALVTTVLGSLGATVALRRGHRGVVHRLAVLTWVWGVLVTTLAVVLALTLDAPERIAIAVLLVLGGTYTLVLGLALWGAARVMPAPAAPDGAADDDVTVTGPATPPGATPTVDDLPTPAAAPDDTHGEWPEWGSGDTGRPAGTEASTTSPGTAGSRPGAPAPSRPVAPTPARSSAPVPAPEPAPVPNVERRTRPVGPDGPVDVDETRASAGAEPARPRTSPARPVPKGNPTRTASADSPATGARPPRRSVTSGGSRPAPATPAADPATERIARQDAEDGPPTQRLPPVVE